jgi:NADH oxidase (H2O2-forming)
MVTTEKGNTYHYDSLVLAHGGSLFEPPIPGIKLGGVFACKRLADADAIAAHTGSSVVVIGSGAIGIESAEALKKKKYAVTVVEMVPYILPVLFDEPASHILEQRLEEAGISVFCGEKVLRFEGSTNVEKVVTDKREINCDTVILATGVKAGIALAHTAGIECGKGIKVDRGMRTNVKDIYACGDVAEAMDLLTGQPCLYQLKHNAIDEGRVAAKSILGMKAEYVGSYPFARIHFFDTHSMTFGQTAFRFKDKPNVEVIDRTTNKGYLRLILQDGKLIGGQAVGEVADKAGILIAAMFRGDDFNKLRADWPKIAMFDSPWPWQYRMMGKLLGLSSLDVT